MDSTANGKKRRQNKTDRIKNKSDQAEDNFTQDMRFIVTRNKRNSWVDEIYDCTPDTGDYPVFN